jgi:hypothetical protein
MLTAWQTEHPEKQPPVTLSVTGGADLRESWAKPTAYGEGFAWPVLEQVNGGDGV